MSAKRAFSDEGRKSPDSYSDDFASDDDKKTPKHKRTTPPRKNSDHLYYQDKLFDRGSGSLRSKIQGHGLRKGRGNGRGNSLSSEPADMKKNNDSVATRVLSASRNRINDLRNKIEEMKIKIRELEQENKLFKITQFRQEKTIRTFSDKENDLPLILEKHNNEIRALKEQNRRLKEKYEKSDRYLRDAEDELEKVKKKMNKYKEICENKELMERDELSRKLATAELEVDEKETKIKELQRHIDVLKKSHRHELGIEFARQKDVKKQLEELKEKYSQLGNQLKEKDKALDYQNIHSKPRQGKLSRNHSPDSTLSWKTKRKTSSMTELTPREKAKFYSEKQRAELYKQRELKDEQGRKMTQTFEEDKEKNTHPVSSSDFSFRTINKTLKDTEKKTKLGTREKSNNNKENMNRQKNETLPMQKNELEKQPNKARQTREDRETRGREEQKSEQKELHLMETEKRDDHEKKENRVEKQDITSKIEERSRHLQEENLESDLFLQERKKKDELLKKLKGIDEPFSQPLPIKKVEDRASGYEGFNDSPFTKLNDLHPIKPSHQETPSKHLELQKNKRQSSSDDAVGYKPSFGPTRENINKPGNKPSSVFDDDDEPLFKINKTPSNTMAQHNDKKPHLLETLFGPQANSSKNLSTKKVQENDTFFISDKPSYLDSQTAAVTNSTFPWEINTDRTKSNKSTFESDRKPAIMNGSPALFNIDTLDNNNKVPPRLQRQQNPHMFPAKPSVTTFDNFSDDIEEVVL